MAFSDSILERARLRREKYAKIIAAANNDSELAMPQRETKPIEKKITVSVLGAVGSGSGMSGEAINYTDEQLSAIELACKKRSFCLIGSAGTGKTTTVRAIATAMINRKILGNLRYSTKHLNAGSPAIAFVAFTNRAVENIRKSLPEEFQDNALTIHKLLEPVPQWTEYTDKHGEVKRRKEFVFSRHATNPISDLQCVVVEESSMVSVELHRDLIAACPNAFFIYLGDLNQLQPIYGPAILGFRLLSLPVVELTKVWRQALDSDIIKLAQHIKDGNAPTNKWLEDNLKNGQVELRPYKGSWGKDAATVKFSFHIRNVLSDEFNEETDAMLCPQNVGFGSEEINKVFAQIFGERRDALVYEIIGGYNKHYLAVGDRVMYNKRDFIIEDIEFNSNYTGQMPIPPSKFLDRWGRSTQLAGSEMEDVDFDALAAALNIDLDSDDIEEKVNQASHKLTLRPLYPLYQNEMAVINTAGDMNALALSYCISVHKAQGSEWEKVYVVLHKSHGRMLSRELLYTAVTRAKKKLVIYYDPDSSSLTRDGNLTTATRNVGIKGNSLKAKAEVFKGKAENLSQDLKDHLEFLGERDANEN